MSHTFFNASLFNLDVSQWEVSSANNMSRMFLGASSFNQNVSHKVANMGHMFCRALSFNHDVSGWEVSNVISKTPLEDILLSALNVSSFFEGRYVQVSRCSRRRFFAGEMWWYRRKYFAMFLAGQLYI